MRPSRLFESTTFRLAAVYVLLFAGSVAVLGGMVYFITATALERRLDARIADGSKTLVATFQTGGLKALESAVQTHEITRPGGPLEYLIVGANDVRLAGDLPIEHTPLGWSNDSRKEGDGDISHRRVLTVALPGGVRLAVGADREEIDEIQNIILDGFMSAFLAVLALGAIGGVALSLAFLKRVEAIRRTVEAIIAGDLTQRVPVRGTNDDLDRLSLTLNRMLDRIAELMESLRQVSADIAHDLKTPLARLRQRLETTRGRAQTVEEHNAAIEVAIAHVDEILGIFGALLRIAQIEAGTRRSGFRELDLSAIFANVVDAFAPVAEDGGKRLSTDIEPAIRFRGDRELLTQMVANLVENAIRHTPTGTRIVVSLGSHNDRIIGTVMDNGPGAPVDERQRIFQRLYRLEHSRSTPGSGLGLSLVKAVADLHDITLEVRDAEPGLQISMSFPDARQRETTQRQSAQSKRNFGNIGHSVPQIKNGAPIASDKIWSPM